MLSSAYICWEQQWLNEPLLLALVIIDDIAMTAIWDYNALPPIKPLLHLFNCKFKSIVSFRAACWLVVFTVITD